MSNTTPRILEVAVLGLALSFGWATDPGQTEGHTGATILAQLDSETDPLTAPDSTTPGTAEPNTEEENSDSLPAEESQAPGGIPDPAAADPLASPAPDSLRPATPLAIPSLTPEQVTDEQVDQLVTALVDIEPLLREASTELRRTQDPDEQRQIEQTFETEATAIVEDSGLTVDQYRQFINLANANPEFGQRVAQQLREVQNQQANEDTVLEDGPQPEEPSETDPETEVEPEVEAEPES